MKKLFMFMMVVIFTAFCFSCGNDDIPEPKPNNPQQDTLVPDDPKPDDPEPDDPEPDDPEPDDPEPDDPEPDEPELIANLGTFIYEDKECQIGVIKIRSGGSISLPGKEKMYNEWTIDCSDVDRTINLEFNFATPMIVTDVYTPEIPNGENVVTLGFLVIKIIKGGFVGYKTEYKKSTMNIVLQKKNEDQFNGDFKAEVSYVDKGVAKKVAINYTGDFIFDR